MTGQEGKPYALRVLEGKPRNSILYTITRHISRSGGSRVIDVYVWDRDDLWRVWIHDARLPKIDHVRGGYVLRGYGTNHAAELVHGLGIVSHDDARWFTNQTLA